jgi:aminopeptidase 2
MWEQFVTNEQAGALRMDSLASSHPIQVPIKHAEEVEQVFDAISYLSKCRLLVCMYVCMYVGNVCM